MKTIGICFLFLLITYIVGTCSQSVIEQKREKIDIPGTLFTTVFLHINGGVKGYTLHGRYPDAFFLAHLNRWAHKVSL